MNKKIVALTVMALIMGSAFGYAITASEGSPLYQKQTDWIVNYDVETTHLDEQGNVLSYEKTHNVLTDAGKNWIRDLIGSWAGGSTAMKYIALGNGTAPTSGSTSLNGEITDCGLDRTAGTYTAIGTGNWSISYLFTSTCDDEMTNSTALLNASSSGTMFMGDTFSDVTLQTGHQLNITITQWVS